MRIIAGKARGTRLLTPQDNKIIRPTSDYIRENLFNIIQNDVQGAAFLDLFAGTGAVGIEALSRGAASATFIDNSQKSIELIKKNLQKTKLSDLATVIKHSIPEALSKPGLKNQKFNIIFLDPPYFTDNLAGKTLEEILKQEILISNGLIALEAPKQEQITLPQNIEIWKEKIYGNSKLIFLINTGY